MHVCDFTSGFFNKLSFIRLLDWRCFVYDLLSFEVNLYSCQMWKVHSACIRRDWITSEDRLTKSKTASCFCVYIFVGSFFLFPPPTSLSPSLSLHLSIVIISPFFSNWVRSNNAVYMVLVGFVYVCAIMYRYFCHCVLWETESNVFIIDSSSSRLTQWATDAKVAAATGCVLCECVCMWESEYIQYTEHVWNNKDCHMTLSI